MDTIAPTTYDFKKKATEALTGAKTQYLDDLNAMSEEQLIKCPGGCARTPADFTYEIVTINKRIAKRMRGEDPGPFKFEGWMTAPKEFNNKQAIVGEFESTTKEIEDALANVPEDQMLRKIELPSGETSPYDLARFCASHMSYHDAQLNYVQTLHDDKEVHWKFDD